MSRCGEDPTVTVIPTVYMIKLDCPECRNVSQITLDDLDGDGWRCGCGAWMIIAEEVLDRLDDPGRERGPIVYSALILAAHENIKTALEMHKAGRWTDCRQTLRQAIRQQAAARAYMDQGVYDDRGLEDKGETGGVRG